MFVIGFAAVNLVVSGSTFAGTNQSAAADDLAIERMPTAVIEVPAGQINRGNIPTVVIEVPAGRANQGQIPTAVIEAPVGRANQGEIPTVFIGTHESNSPDMPTSDSDVGGSGPMEISDFVKQVFVEGLPYDKANQYDASVVPELLEILEDPEREAHWANVVIVLGVIGDERAVEPLLAFIEKGVEGQMSYRHHVARDGALVGLGYLVNKTGNEKALNYLKAGVIPETWEAKKITGIASYESSTAERNENLSKRAIVSLGLSGNPSAAEALRLLQKPMDAETKKAFQSQISGLVSQALKDNEKISNKGLSAYYREACISFGNC